MAGRRMQSQSASYRGLSHTAFAYNKRQLRHTGILQKRAGST